jgi:hypothetical protein
MTCHRVVVKGDLQLSATIFVLNLIQDRLFSNQTSAKRLKRQLCLLVFSGLVWTTFTELCQDHYKKLCLDFVFSKVFAKWSLIVEGTVDHQVF